jgi:hypothetical protein
MTVQSASQVLGQAHKTYNTKLTCPNLPCPTLPGDTLALLSEHVPILKTERISLPKHHLQQVYVLTAYKQVGEPLTQQYATVSYLFISTDLLNPKSIKKQDLKNK